MRRQGTSFDDSTNMISDGDLSGIEVMAENSAGNYSRKLL